MTLVASCLIILQRTCLSGTVTEIWRLKDKLEDEVTTLTFWGHVTSSVTNHSTPGDRLLMGGE